MINMIYLSKILGMIRYWWLYFHFSGMALFTLFSKKPILLFFGHSIEDTIVQTGEATLDGVKAIGNVTSGALQPEIQKIKNDVDKKEVNNNVPQPDDTIDSVNRARGTNQDKLGYCYVGTDQGYRSCIDVENADECLSGDIFPTRDICINPNLRQ